MVQAGQAGEVLFGDGWSRPGGDQTVGVGRVSDHQNLDRSTGRYHGNATEVRSAVTVSRGHLDSLLGELVQGGALRLEDGHVGLQQVLALHPLLAGHGAHQDGRVDVLEAHLHLVRGDHLCGGGVRPSSVRSKPKPNPTRKAKANFSRITGK